MNITLPLYVESLIERLIEKGFDSYAVGGAIRDSVMGITPMDWDIATQGEPWEVMEVFADKRVIKTGEKYGTVTVVEAWGKTEITTFRSEGSYSDGRHPDWVRFEKNIETDLSRRDFTINAIAYNKEKGIVDPFGGVKDIKSGVIRAVGNPKDRFLEDGLRMMRAVRFYTKHSFEIEESTKEAICTLAKNIKTISNERIKDELCKILIDPNASKGIEMLLQTGLLQNIIPDIDLVKSFDNASGDFVKRILCMLDNTPDVLSIRLAALFLKEETGDTKLRTRSKCENSVRVDVLKALKELCFAKDIIEKSKLLADNLEIFDWITDRGYVKRLIKNMGKNNIKDFISLLKAQALCSREEAFLDKVLTIERIVNDVINNKEPLDIKDLDIDGEDIRKMGFEEGKIIGDILEYLNDEVLNAPELNDKNILIGIIKDKWKDRIK